MWWLITPRALRRATLAVLLAWLAVALAHHNGLTPRTLPVQLPVQVAPAGPR